jgi:hypothetical protein
MLSNLLPGFMIDAANLNGFGISIKNFNSQEENKKDS